MNIYYVDRLGFPWKESVPENSVLAKKLVSEIIKRFPLAWINA